MIEPSPDLVLPSLFADHMVLQRGAPHRVWGWDRPGVDISLRVEGLCMPAGAPTIAATGRSDREGRFFLVCPALPVGGPYRLRIRGSSERVIEDVLVGDVWLASGQSNMEWKVSSSRDSEHEIAQAELPAIRMFQVAHTVAGEPQRGVAGAWLVCAPDRVGDFSAVGYFFARELLRRLDVPLGVIDASWGGTPIEAWLSLEAFRVVPGAAAELEASAARAPDLPRLQREQRERVLAWERDHLPADPGNKGERRGWARPDFDDRTWPVMRLPGTWQARGLAHNGVVWFRRIVEVPASWAGRDLTLSLGAIDDFDTSYFDGIEVGGHPKGTPGAFQIRRRYRVPGKRVRAGRTVIAVRVFDHVGDGGIVGPPAELSLSPTEPRSGDEAIPLVGDWRYQVEHVIVLVSRDVFRTYPAALVPEPQDTPAALYNAMIAPLVPFGLKGALWYQGERNVADHARYRAMQIALVRDWRARFGIGQFPFYWVQLANYKETPDWPFLREAQAQALSEPNTGMAVTIDIGDPDDIHPRDKQEVGRRLSLLALARTYGAPADEDSGPTLARVEIAGSAVRVHFRHAGGLRLRGGGNAAREFALAGADGLYHRACGRIEGESVVVECDLVPRPLTVRYAWADAPDVNLENAAGLPAAPFRTDGHAT